MADETAISWTDHTHNPWIGCEHAPNPDGTTAPECDNCYAEATDHRFHASEHWGPGSARKFMSDAYWKKPLTWNRRAEKEGVRRRVFCASQADVFERTGDHGLDLKLDTERARLWRLIVDTPHLDWLLLTKRPNNAATMLPWVEGSPNHLHMTMSMAHGRPIGANEPWPNVWLGVTCGHPSSMWRVAKLREIPAAKRFVSCEPMLADFTDEQWDTMLGTRFVIEGGTARAKGMIDWLIVGDESGRGRRPAHVDWVRRARDAAERYAIAFHFKQWNSPATEAIHDEPRDNKARKIHLPILDGRQWAEFP